MPVTQDKSAETHRGPGCSGTGKTKARSDANVITVSMLWGHNLHDDNVDNSKQKAIYRNKVEKQ